MPHLSAEAKHHILLEYDPYHRYRSFAALARKHDVAGGRETVERWFHRWDRTPSSLEECPRTGRPRVLSVDDVHELVTPIIRRANQENRVIDYAQVAELTRRTGSLTTLKSLTSLRKTQAVWSARELCGSTAEPQAFVA
jgi:transposase